MSNICPTTTITQLDDGKNILIITNNEGFLRRIDRACEKYPDQVLAEMVTDMTWAVRLPLRWLDIRPPRRLTDEERQRRSEWLTDVNRRKREVNLKKMKPVFQLEAKDTDT